MAYTFTIKKALEIQEEQLKEWRLVLNTKAYETLMEEVNLRNSMGYKNADEVCRGVDICTIVYNKCMKKLKMEQYASVQQ